MALRAPILVIRHSGRQKHNTPPLEALRGPAGMDLRRIWGDDTNLRSDITVPHAV